MKTSIATVTLLAFAGFLGAQSPARHTGSVTTGVALGTDASDHATAPETSAAGTHAERDTAAGGSRARQTCAIITAAATDAG